jgi:hypothetical protein
MDTYVVQKKIVTVHTEDRDVTKWPTPTQFEIDLPVDYKNVVSMRLNEIELPVPLYVFSEQDQNVKLAVESVNGPTVVIEIKEGNYTGEELALELSGQLSAATGNTFDVIYDKVARKMIFTSTAVFELFFDRAEFYPCCTQKYYDNYTKWGLGSYLGFEKKRYLSTQGDVNLYAQAVSMPGVHFVAAPNILDVHGDTNVYLELAAYNNIDELMPYTERSSDLYYSKHGGKHNSSFAKIPLRDRSTKEDYLANIFFSEPPLERIQKFRFKLRYHDGRPVHFHGLDYNFSIEMTTLRNDPAKNFIVNRNNYALS